MFMKFFGNSCSCDYLRSNQSVEREGGRIYARRYGFFIIMHSRMNRNSIQASELSERAAEAMSEGTHTF